MRTGISASPTNAGGRNYSRGCGRSASGDRACCARGWRVTRQARDALAQAWLRLLASRHPDVCWRLIRPGEGGERHPVPAPGKILGSLTPPENERALEDLRVSGAADKDGIERGGE